MYEYYRLELGEDGTTFKRIEDRLVFHPILAPYLICDPLEVHKQTDNPAALQAAHQIADSALACGEAFIDDSFVFWYRPEDGLSTVPGTFYSGLTQSWYIKAFCRLARIDRRYAAVVPRFFRSLTVTTKQGGVLLKRDFGWTVEEYPHEPAFYTLNGWLTVLRWVAEDRLTLRQMGCEVDVFLRENLAAVEHLLPLYDLPELFNTRYQLTGFVRLQLLSGKATDLRPLELSVTVPREGRQSGLVVSGKYGRWQNCVERTEARLLQLNVVLSMISYPRPNIVELRVVSTAASRATWRIADSAYDPMSTGLPTVGWKSIAEVDLSEGINYLSVDLEMGHENLIAYPTNFKKKVKGPDGLNYNGYHFVHVIDLAVLYKLTGHEFLKVWGER